MLIAREKEKEILLNLCSKEKSSLAVVYGRRRIGKTYLIQQMFKEYKDDCLYFSFTGSFEQDSKVQIKNFIESIDDWFKYEPIKKIEDWTDAFILLKKAIKNEIEKTSHKGKVVIFIDEVSWIDKTSKSGFLSSLGHFWNTFCEANENIVLILCGSNASWIKNKILKDTQGPLYQRVDEEISMLPFTLKETKEYLEHIGFNLDEKKITELYMILGGVAKYLTYLDVKLSFSENIDKIFFRINAPLYGEYDMVFKTLFYDRHTYHKNLVDMLCNKQSGYTTGQLADKLKILSSNKTLRIALDELIDTGFVKAISKFNQNTRDVKYIISDPFCLFYNKWVKPLSKNDISTLKDYWNNQVDTQAYAIWTGFSFEAICIMNIDLYLNIRGNSANFKNVYYWNYKSSDDSNNKGAQIDFIVEYNHNLYDLVECKYYKNEFIIDSEYKNKLENKINMFKEFGIKSKSKYELKLVMLSTYGTKRNINYNSLNIAKDITLKQLLK